MENPFRRHNRKFWTREERRSLYEGIAFIAIAIVIQIFAGQYSARRAVGANFANDVLLDNLPAFNFDSVIVGGGIAFWVLASWLLALRPKKLLFGMKAIALFIITRAFFFSLTHLGAYPRGIPPGVDNLGWSFYSLLTFQGNFFFSGHTGFPFLMALIFWDDDFWRPFFIAASVAFGASVLLAHVHYSIDVFAAPFIVYGIYGIARHAFRKDYAVMLS